MDFFVINNYLILFHKIECVYNTQEYNLDESITADNVTKESLDKIVKAGEDLLKQTVKAKDITSFDPHEKPIEGTNAEALERFVHINNIFICL
jgi:hypothetical protein